VGDVIDIQATSLFAVQPQFEPVVALTLPFPPAAGIEALNAESP